MQGLAVEARELAAKELGKLAELRLEALAIERGANQGMADMGKMHAHLVGAAGLERAFEQGGDCASTASEGRDHAPMGHSLASLAGGHHRHLGPTRGMAAYACIDSSVASGRRSPHQREIAPLELTRAAMVDELVGQRVVRLIGLGHDQKA